MVKRNFTEKEKIVFYGIITYPGINDNVLSDLININPSTIATIRNKLKKQDYFKVIRIPYFQNCGFELLTVSYDRLYSPNLPEPPSSILGNIYKRVSNYFYLLSAPDSWFSLGFFQNYLNLQKINEISRYNKYKNGLQEDTEKQIIFPFGLTKIYNFFDYGQIIRNFFGLDLDLSSKKTESTEDILRKLSGQSILDKTSSEPKMNPPESYLDVTHLEPTDYQDFTLDTRTDLKFTKAEREVFLALVQYPDLSDFAINKIISISATSINNIRKKFESQSIIKQRIIPNLSLLGFELITLTHLKFKSYGNLSARIEIINRVLTKKPSFLYISSNTDEIILAAYKNFSEYQHVNEEMVRLYRDKDLLASEPRTLLFPLSESVMVKSHSYVPLVNQFLGSGKSIINSVLEIIGKKIGETGKQILIKHLDSSEMLNDEITAKDIPKLIQIIQEVMTPIFGEKSANDIANKIKKMEK